MQSLFVASRELYGVAFCGIEGEAKVDELFSISRVHRVHGLHPVFQRHNLLGLFDALLVQVLGPLSFLVQRLEDLEQLCLSILHLLPQV